MIVATEDLDPEDVAATLRASLGLLYRRLKQTRGSGQVTLPESSALSRLERGGAMTAAQLARQEQISPQSIAATLASLELSGLVQRAADPTDGRRIMLSLTTAGQEEVHSKRAARSAQLAHALKDFTQDELAVLSAASPLLERLSQMD